MACRPELLGADPGSAVICTCGSCRRCLHRQAVRAGRCSGRNTYRAQAEAFARKRLACSCRLKDCPVCRRPIRHRLELEAIRRAAQTHRWFADFWRVYWADVFRTRELSHVARVAR